MLMPRSLVVAVSLLVSSLAFGAESLNVERELSRPGVKLLAVDVYATWCEPCMKAMPKWKALKETYREQGLRVIMVHTQDPGKPCGEGVSDFADDVICDEKGYMANWLRVRESLPAAFLWSWQGNMLVKTGHIDKVEAEVQTYLSSVPRVSIEARGPGGEPSQDLRDWVRGELQRASKFTLVATEEEREIAARIRQQSHQANYDGKTKCKLGQEISANASLQVRVGGEGDDRQLILSLFSAEKGCSLGMASVDYREGAVLSSVQEGVDMLMGQLRNPSTEMPGGVQTSLKKAGFGAELSAISIPEVERLQLSEIQFDIEGAELEFLEAWTRFDSTIELAAKLDQKETITPDKKVMAWDGVLRVELPEIPKSFRDIYAARISEARQRRDTWSAVIEAERQAEEAWRVSSEKYVRDLDRLERFKALPDKIVSAEQKKAYEEEFEAVYAPYFAERERRRAAALPPEERAKTDTMLTSSVEPESEEESKWNGLSLSRTVLRGFEGAPFSVFGIQLGLPSYCWNENYCFQPLRFLYAPIDKYYVSDQRADYDTTHSVYAGSMKVSAVGTFKMFELNLGVVSGLQWLNGARPQNSTTNRCQPSLSTCPFFGQYLGLFGGVELDLGLKLGNHWLISVEATVLQTVAKLWVNVEGEPTRDAIQAFIGLPKISYRF